MTVRGEARTSNGAELMDGIYRRQRHVYDATRKYYLLGRDRLIDELAPPPGGTVLELGCGTARNLVLAARRHPQARFFGIDISEQMLESARGSIRRAGLEGRVSVAQGDATAFDAAALFGVGRFDRVFFSYSLSMIPPWREALMAGAGALSPGGRLHLVDFGMMEAWPGLVRAPFRAWLAAFHVAPRAELEAALADCAQAQGARATFRRLHGGYAVTGRLEA
ncbi:class I SAM-dependent methyltransferase [Stappia sp. WLB 29]|uniref:class I SAM-dependent methyltransferase n=1 Tax=Stappia sp. WLB 29 TaxID=2925220 RepID=UPI0020C06FD9|nr:class I SAM-dependent methyltransferase [Stappia sp. WLB 29]